MRCVEDVLDYELFDDDNPWGGISFPGETVRDFAVDLDIPFDTSVEDLNNELEICGIKPIKED